MTPNVTTQPPSDQPPPNRDRLRKHHRLATASQLAQRTLAKLKPTILNIKGIRILEGKEVRNEPAIRDAKKKLDATRDATAGIRHLVHTTMTSPEKKMRHLQGLRLQKEIVKKTGGAQCGELSQYVFYRCFKEGLFPFYMIRADRVNLWQSTTRLDNHAFVAIGLSNPGTASDMTTWPDDVVICDPWVMELIRETDDKTATNPGAYTVSDYMVLVRNYFLDGGRVKVLYGHEQPLGTTSINPIIGGARATHVKEPQPPPQPQRPRPVLRRGDQGPG